MILPANGLNRCTDHDDWVRLEVEHAFRCKKNIVPVMMRNFEFPKSLPESLADLPKLQGINANFELFNGVILKLKAKLLKSCANNI